MKFYTGMNIFFIVMASVGFGANLYLGLDPENPLLSGFRSFGFGLCYGIAVMTWDASNQRIIKMDWELKKLKESYDKLRAELLKNLDRPLK